MRLARCFRWGVCTFAAVLVGGGFVVGAIPLLTAQDGRAAGEGQGLTLRVQSRLVVEDLLVTDRNGRPVHGLPKSAFHVFDQGEPQTIKSFEEGAVPSTATDAAGDAVPVDALPTGVFTNANRFDAHTASEVLLIDADDMVLTDQMFLLDQLRRAIQKLPPGLQVAVFRVSHGRTVLIRGFSTDRADLRRAVEECLPGMGLGADSKFQSAVEQLMTVAAYLEQTPGRKNVLWFAGEFPLVTVSEQNVGMDTPAPDVAARAHVIHQIQELLAEARISVYPVDVRGVITTDISAPSPDVTIGAGGVGANVQGRNPSAALASRTQVMGPSGDGPAEQRDAMRELARATGGRAYMLNNIATEVEQAFDLGTRAYTLTYTPAHYAIDDSWHKVRITVDGNYQLSYRPGYLASWTANPEQREGFRLVGGGEKVAAGAEARKPVLFQVKVMPVADAGAKGMTRLAVQYLIPADQLTFAHGVKGWSNQVLVTSYAYDPAGKIKNGKLQELDTSLTEEQWPRAQKQVVSTRQTVDVPKGAKYLLFLVRDKRSDRTGSITLSMRAVRALPAASPGDVSGSAAAPAPAGAGGSTPLR